MKYFYGPVPSRRLGLSLGINLLPEKSCSFDCLYCQLGLSKKKRTKRFSCVDFQLFQKELKEKIKTSSRIDYITVSGSGEPTLHKNLDKIFVTIRKITKNNIPICLITNSSLLYRKDVRREINKADLIIPSLDAACAKTFRTINRPAKNINFNKILFGLVELRKEFKGKIWLEIMLVKGINDTLAEAKKFKNIVKKIKPDKIQLNLPVRPSAHKVFLPDKERVARIADIISGDIEIVADFTTRKKETRKVNDLGNKIMDFLKSRPATLEDLFNSLTASKKDLRTAVNKLINEKRIKPSSSGRQKYLTIYD